MGQEIELKLALLPEYADQVAGLTLLEGSDDGRRQCRQLDNIYFDTPANDLSRARVALRIRRDGDRYIQTLKTAGSDRQAGLSSRKEWEWERPEPTLDIELVRSHLPEELIQGKLLEQLEPRFETNFERRIWWLSGEDEEGAWAIEVALDQGEIVASDRREPISELELELKQGQTDRLFHIALELARQLPLHVLDISKAQRGYRLCGAEMPLAALQVHYRSDAETTLVELVSECLKHWPAQLAAACHGDTRAPAELLNTLDLLLVALQGLPDVAEHCQVLISQYQRLRAEVALAHDWRRLAKMPEEWRQAQQRAGLKRLRGLQHKTLPGQLALATGELLWQLSDEEAH